MFVHFILLLLLLKYSYCSVRGDPSQRRVSAMLALPAGILLLRATCQRLDWVIGGHRDMCHFIRVSRLSSFFRVSSDLASDVDFSASFL
jgi:hypothetical protein